MNAWLDRLHRLAVYWIDLKDVRRHCHNGVVFPSYYICPPLICLQQHLCVADFMYATDATSAPAILSALTVAVQGTRIHENNPVVSALENQLSKYTATLSHDGKWQLEEHIQHCTECQVVTRFPSYATSSTIWS